MNEVADYMKCLVEFAHKIGVDPDELDRIKNGLTKNLDENNVWCLFHGEPYYWLYHYLVCLRFDNYWYIDWSDIDQLKISDESKKKIKSIKNCHLCKKELLDDDNHRRHRSDVNRMFASRAINKFLFDNETMMYYPEKVIECKHHLI
jgi:hypothetical protein